jgi:predicted RNA-binding Zn-ribbon protein involved in translation (DUF1610 family)
LSRETTWVKAGLHPQFVKLCMIAATLCPLRYTVYCRAPAFLKVNVKSLDKWFQTARETDTWLSTRLSAFFTLLSVKPQHSPLNPNIRKLNRLLNTLQIIWSIFSRSCVLVEHTRPTSVSFFLSQLHPTWRDALKRKYTTLIPQNGAIPPIPMECQLAMLSVTLTQWCVEERLELPSAKIIGPSSSVFAIQDPPPTVEDTGPALADLPFNVSPPSILFGHTSIDTVTVDRAIQHIVCYVDRGSQKSSYPKCTACGLPGRTLDKCHPLVNFCLDQALTAQHPDIVKRSKAAYAQFPRSNCSCPPRVSSVKQLVSMLDLPPKDSISGTDDQNIMHSSHHIDLIETIDLSAENVSHGHSGSAIVSFQDRSWFPSSQESPAQVFKLVESHAPQCVLFQEDTPHEHQVHSMHPHHALLVDLGSTITTVGRSDMLRTRHYDAWHIRSAYAVHIPASGGYQFPCPDCASSIRHRTERSSSRATRYIFISSDSSSSLSDIACAPSPRAHSGGLSAWNHPPLSRDFI